MRSLFSWIYPELSWIQGCEPYAVHTSLSVPTYVGRTYNLAVNPPPADSLF